MQQLADEAHLPLSTARAKKSKLIKRGLLARGERFSPKNNAQLADLIRVNLDLLASMKRPRSDYGPTLVEELTFAAPQETPSSDPPLESSGAGALESSTLLLPSSSPSSLPSVTADADGASGTATDGGEREAAAPDASVPEPRAAEPEAPADRVARVWAAQRAALGVVTSPARVKAMAKEAGWLLATGLPVELLEAEVTLMASEPTWFSLVKHMESRKPAESAGGREERCPDHPARYRKGCLDCAMAVPA
ncbi:hypothetical protein ACFV2D_36820 [Streptomyces capillispiralis]|uniref:hypothetical protein n=1 Tax=Streptomyces capillispiralis TaxID=68182 RepID=UPI0036A2CC9C